MLSARMNRYLPVIIFVIVAAIGLGMTMVVNQAEESAAESRFEVVADEAADRVRERVSQHIAFLRSAHSFFVSHRGPVTQDAFESFVSGLELASRFNGIQGIGFARRIETGDESGIALELLNYYGIEREVWPETSENIRTPIVLLEPNDERNAAALGYDMYAEPARRAAMDGALVTDGPYASAPVQLVQEITSDKQAGFLVFIPLRDRNAGSDPAPVTGFVYAPFRAGDLHMAALERTQPLPVVVETHDVTGGEERFLYRSPDFEEVADAGGSLVLDRTFDIAGRNWKMTVYARPGFRSPATKVGTFALAAISLLLAAALAASTRSQMMAVQAARKLHASSEKSLKDKDMMLQEMKHRIKNSIARVLAIARQTAAHSDSLEEFSESYMARLQAMSGAQDMLTRSHWQRADLGELLSKELEQVFGTGADYAVSGPDVDLSERATQALGLVFHELATNALKYGGVSEAGGGLKIDWSVRRGKKGGLELVWRETSPTPVAEPQSQGFGTRLIDANIRGELGGSIDREFSETGLSVRLTIPADGYA